MVLWAAASVAVAFANIAAAVFRQWYLGFGIGVPAEAGPRDFTRTTLAGFRGRWLSRPRPDWYIDENTPFSRRKYTHGVLHLDEFLSLYSFRLRWALIWGCCVGGGGP